MVDNVVFMDKIVYNVVITIQCLCIFSKQYLCHHHIQCMSTLLNQMDKTDFSNNHHIHCNTSTFTSHTCICYTVNILHKA